MGGGGRVRARVGARVGARVRLAGRGYAGARAWWPTTWFHPDVNVKV